MFSLSKTTVGLILAISALVVFVFIVLGGTFFVGMRVGEYRSAEFTTRRFRQAGFPPEMIGDMDLRRHPPMPQEHGFGGEVTRIGTGSLVVVRRDGKEQTIFFDAETPVLPLKENHSLKDIVVGINVIAIGEPDADGIIRATMFILPPWQSPSL